MSGYTKLYDVDGNEMFECDLRGGFLIHSNLRSLAQTDENGFVKIGPEITSRIERIEQKIDLILDKLK